jgi:hypothetical protein
MYINYVIYVSYRSLDEKAYALKMKYISPMRIMLDKQFIGKLGNVVTHATRSFFQSPFRQAFANPTVITSFTPNPPLQQYQVSVHIPNFINLILYKISVSS